MGGSRLRPELDQVPSWRAAPDGTRHQVEIRQLAEDFACYLYLPRLLITTVLTGAIQDGLRLLTWEQDAFAYAESYEPAMPFSFKSDLSRQ